VLVIADSTPSIGLAFAAGLASFLSPCVLPLVPGYLSTVCGLTPGELRATRGAQLRGVVTRSGLFILTFSAIFVLLGAALVLMAATLALVFNARLRLLPLALALAAAAMTFGALSIAGGDLTMASIAALPVLIGLAVDYAIQFQARYNEAAERGEPEPGARRGSG